MNNFFILHFQTTHEFFKKKRVKYELAPQTKFYDLMSAKWRPFVMFNQFSNIRSKICNTDNHGLRFNHSLNLGKNDSIFNQYNNKKDGAAIVGNSLSFGEGQSCDEKTISSVLSAKLNIIFITLAEGDFQFSENS